MSKIELIKAEIERRKNEWQALLDNNNGEPNIIKEIIYEDLNILAFINSLPDEPSENIGQLNLEDLEKAADEYADGIIDRGDAFMCKAAFIVGAKWQKEQMMKNAFWCEVVGEKRDLRLIDSTERCLFDAERGDWLKIIIVKED